MLSRLFRIADRWRHRARLRSENNAHAWGKRGEDLAHRFLQKRGYIIVGRNYRTKNGSAEVDLIAKDGDTLVFVEVKTRASEEFGAPEAAVDHEKHRRIVRAATEYIRRADTDPDKTRFDIVSVTWGDGERVSHYPDAFRPPAT